MITQSQKEIDTEFWYLLASKPKQEQRAVENLRNQEIIAYSPLLKVEKLVKGRRQIVIEPMFAGYVFVKINPNNPNWHRIRSTRGVRDWVKFSGEPAKISQEVIDSLSITEEQENENVKSLLEFGAQVKIEKGPFQGLNGIFEASEGELRSIILIEFLGKRNRIIVGNEQISVE